MEIVPKSFACPCGLIRGALANLGVVAVVTAEIAAMPACKFQILSSVIYYDSINKFNINSHCFYNCLRCFSQINISRHSCNTQVQVVKMLRGYNTPSYWLLR